MAIIDPSGLFRGERLARCSQEAQLHWPRLFAASNGLARLELDYDRIIATAYPLFKNQPTKEELFSWIREYHENFLLFVYSAPDGSAWGQWLTDSRFLSRYRTADERRSPSPDEKAIEEYRRSYTSKKSNKINDIFKPFATTPNHTKPPSTTPVGIGNGIGNGKGEGVGENPAPNDAKSGFALSGDPPVIPKPEKKNKFAKSKPEVDWRFSVFRAAYEEDFLEQVGVPAAWDGKEATNFSRWLKANPTITEGQWQDILRHRRESPVNRGSPISFWISKALSWLNEPADDWGRPINGGKNAKVSGGAGSQPMGVLASTMQRRQRQRAADQNGHLPAGQDGRSDAGTVHAVPRAARPARVPGRDDDYFAF